ncbi:Cas1p-domain-containing protein [Saitoella complicata NRRL Y-17804]|nr:Cas1p-domain-containing protein [Saitoella complicata NRRL Y-17804]ODQ54488.1 Cas1p-domain-containing protein [Saitoella complicata NRRL Y-17804]
MVAIIPQMLGSGKRSLSFPAAAYAVYAAIAVAVIFRFFAAAFNQDPYHCRSLVTKGAYLDPVHAKSWQPSGCVLKSYAAKPKGQSITSASECLWGKRVMFVGDSTVRETFWAFVKLVDPANNAEGGYIAADKKHEDISVYAGDVKMQFFWDPYLNGTGLKALDWNAKQTDEYRRFALAVVGSGLWFARYGSDNQQTSYIQWKDAIDNAVSKMVMAQEAWGPFVPGNDTFVIQGVEYPDTNRLDLSRKASITTQELEAMNNYLHDLSRKHPKLNIMFAAEEMSRNRVSRGKDGLHSTASVATEKANILLNLRCNAASTLRRKFPFDATCCATYNNANLAQLLMVLAIAVATPLLIANYHSINDFASARVYKALLAVGLVVLYCFYADRTHYFEKISKYYTQTSFLGLSFIAAAIAFATITESSKDQPFLARDQTDEWKGWMQIAILIYHYTGASKVAWIYNIIRVLVASYLFQTGFGHFVFFYKKGDFSLKRAAAVLLRLNILPCALAYMMDTDYLFYYFSPLVTVWFGVLWCTMRVGSHLNHNNLFMVGKLLASAVLFTLIIKVPFFVEGLGKLFKAVALLHGDAKEFRFRVALDLYTPWVGVLVGFAFIKSSEQKWTSLPSWPCIRKLAIVASAVVIPVFVWFEATRETKFVYNAWHPYVSFLPILAFIVLRNATQKLRNSHSTAMAWIGRCSLETFILQFHIWLAGDTKTLLIVTHPDWWLLNFVISTVVFLGASYLVSQKTGALTEWIMGVEKKPVAALPTVRDTATVPNEGDHKGKSLALVVKTEGEAIGQGEPDTPVRPTAPRVGTWGQFGKDLRIRLAVLGAGLWVVNLVASI